MYPRQIKEKIAHTLSTGRSILVLGPRQTGKTTLAENLSLDLSISLLLARERQKFEADPDILVDQINALSRKIKRTPLILIDEIQKIPKLFDAVQYLIDKKLGQFILTGSSARKLRKDSNINLLPGRVVVYHMDPLVFSELPFEWQNLRKLLYDGSLPGMVTIEDDNDRSELLDAYATIYLEEEIRTETAIRKLEFFSKFLNLAAKESGNIINISKLSQQVGVSTTTISNYLDILVDSMVAFRIMPYTISNTRTKLTKASKYLIFDLGIRRLCANEGKPLPKEAEGKLLEQWVGLELLRNQHLSNLKYQVNYWRDHNGTEVDYIIDLGDKLIPIEVKLHNRPKQKDAKHLATFIKEYSQAEHGYVICTCDMPMQISKDITALPWQQLLEIFEAAP